MLMWCNIYHFRFVCFYKLIRILSLFQDFVTGLSILSRGSLDEKLRWTFSLYDINGDGCITREEMTDIVTAIYELMGKVAEPTVDEATVNEKVERIFQVRFLTTSLITTFSIHLCSVPNHISLDKCWSALVQEVDSYFHIFIIFKD